MGDPVTFGEWLRQERVARRLTREEFAGRVGCSASALRKIEYGERRPSRQVAELIANCLDIPPAERSAFVRVARGELSLDRLPPGSKPVARPTIAGFSTASASRVNLPVLPTPVIGRQCEVEKLSGLLRDPQCRLLTLVGPGGIGKTRLAIETAFQLSEAFADGIFFVPFAPVTSVRFVAPVIADALGFSFQSASTTDPKTQLFSYLREKQALLVADNLEHLLTEPGIELLAELLASAPRVKLLVTSRESLGLHGEWVFEVQGLPIPTGGQAECGAENTSAELFLQRARRAHVGFTATADDYPAIVRICRLVDGMPLGIELAAAWVRTLPCCEIAREIESGLGFLSVSSRDLPARHRSMRAVFDHSWKLLAPEEQAALLRLSIFEGGFQREAAEQVALASLTVLSALVTKSLIRRGAAGRFDLHELIRQFAAEQFAQQLEEQQETRARHGRYFLGVFGRAYGRLQSSAQREALAELSLEMGNFRLAWDWAVAHGEFALIEQMLGAFAIFFDTRGWLQEGLDYLGCLTETLETRGQTAAPDRIQQVVLGHALATQALLTFRRSQHEQARALLERSITIVRPLNESRVLVEAIAFLGIVMVMLGHHARSLELFNEGLQLATATGNQWFAALCLTQQVAIGMWLGQTENAYERLQIAVSKWRAVGDPRFTAFALMHLSQSAFRLGRYPEAYAALEESVAIYQWVGDRWGLGSAYRLLALVAQAQGEHDKAVEMFQKSVDTLTDLGARWDVARALAEMGRSVLALDDEQGAERIWRESLRLASETQGMHVALEALVGLASLRAKRGDPEQALEWLVIVLEHPASIEETRSRAARLRVEVEAQLTEPQREAAQARARATTVEAAVGAVLMQF